MNKVVKWFVVSIVLVIMSVNICACSDVSAAEVEGDYTSYMCDYKGFSFNTKITTVVDDKEVTIQGKILRFATDPLEMVDKDGNVLAQATDSYNFINQDDHGIIVDGVVELVMQGNFEMVGNSYKLYDGDGEEIGRAEFGWLCSGTIYDINNNVVAIIQRNSMITHDYEVKIYENDMCSDKAILMLAASYVSDYVADEESNDD